MDETILANLNEQQKKAVLHNEGALLVLAGPGSGKTTILTKRIIRLLQESENEKFKILALTFTTKAANEMKERLEASLENDVRRAFIGTFHSFCSDVLKKYGSYIGLNNEFTIYERESDYVHLLIEAIKEEIADGNSENKELIGVFSDEQVLRSNADQLYASISKLKSRLISPENVKDLRIENQKEIGVVYKLYNNKLRANNAVDFADLLFLTHQLFTQKPFISKQYRNNFKYLLIDEAQDTNKAQFELIQAFCGEDYKNLFIVADEDQLIYEWNDARFEYLLQFVKNQQAGILQMFENYRCPKDILTVANRLISININRFSQKQGLHANKHDDNSITLKNFQTPEIEAYEVVKEILKIQNYNETCIIARNKYTLSSFEKELKKNNIPYHIAKNEERFSSLEVQALINILQATFNEEDKLHINQLNVFFKLSSDNISLETDNGTYFMRFI
ncbi:ATP-dependent helicase, partial [Paenibacillus phytohabitans]|uniref:ATP-dependent helicase n=1 Tax=Paenibacillus phytohabitans TaxID=2654978 RepID=UPI00300AAC4F